MKGFSCCLFVCLFFSLSSSAGQDPSRLRERSGTSVGSSKLVDVRDGNGRMEEHPKELYY